jgi:DNA-binding NarL/FixJ family response regulator
MDRLTKRRRQVATLARRRLSNREIAEKLGLTVGTVKAHLHAIYEKLDVHSRHELGSALAHRAKSKHDAAPAAQLAQRQKAQTVT